ncbi:hypothetical protein Sjap_002145 [Stephania japonica]|uniref:cycloartenol synthase n=1 Tax=Stephania japonica TaxID=461633 RepID=A0AAP0KNX3_9MAGN
MLQEGSSTKEIPCQRNANSGISDETSLKISMLQATYCGGEVVKYLECTSASIQALTSFKKLYPGHRREEIQCCISKAVKFIENIQKPDGSWYGSWAVCFTYATWFGMKALVAGGKTFNNSSSVRKACEFLLKKQLASGGWGESYISCQDKVMRKFKSALNLKMAEFEVEMEHKRKALDEDVNILMYRVNEKSLK